MSDNLTLWIGACRYYLGRRTYAVSDFCSMLRRNWQSLDEHTRAIIQREVEEEFDRDDLAREAEDKYKPLGDDCDRREWEAVKRLWIGKYTAPPQRPAEPVQEPVAWRWGYRSVTTGEMDWRGYVEIAADPNLRSPAIIMQPLYAAAPQRKPLTDDEIKKLLIEHAGMTVVFSEVDLRFARAVERAHGIGGQP